MTSRSDNKTMGVPVCLVSQNTKGPEGQCLPLSGLIVRKMYKQNIFTSASIFNHQTGNKCGDQ